MTKFVVSKFGGSSVRDANAMKRCAQIIKNDDNQKVIVVSATYSTTNQLEQLARLSVESLVKGLQFWGTVLDRHLQIAQELDVEAQLQFPFEALDDEAQNLIERINNDGEIEEKVMDQVYSLGERLSSQILAAYLGFDYFDARKVIITNHDYSCALPLIKEIKERALEHLIPLLANKKVVTQGFIGRTLDGNTTTIGREGSDFSAALFGEAIDAELVNIWTDVPGIASCDPRLVPDVQFMANLSYDQATLLAQLGAKVLFPRTLEPAARSNMKVFVGSSIESEATGTIISSFKDDEIKVLGLTCLEVNGRELLSFVGHRLLELTNCSPEKVLTQEGINFDIERQDSDVFSFYIDEKHRDRALKCLHQYLLTFKK